MADILLFLYHSTIILLTLVGIWLISPVVFGTLRDLLQPDRDEIDQLARRDRDRIS